MNNFINIGFRTILILFILFVITKMIGKKQISQLSLFDYIVGITIGSIAADISLDIEKNLINGILSLCLYGIISYLISIITMKSITARRFFSGVPTVLVENGKIIESGLVTTKIDVNEFLSEARIAGYFDLNEINYAIMETNGCISFLPNDKDKPIVKKDMKIKTSNSGLSCNVIIDGELMINNINSINKDINWVKHELSIQGYNDYKDILLASVDSNQKLSIYKKNVKPNKNTILE